MIHLPEKAPSYAIPQGYGYRRLTVPELKERLNLLGTLQIWDYPRSKHHRYVLGIDVGDGLGKDRSVIDVLRMGTVEEVEEQVAQFVTDTLAPSAFAYVVDAIGHLYKWPDGREALAAIECNNHGLSVQDTLQLHLGYQHFYIWEVLDQADPQKRFTTRMGWMTTPRTRPILLDKLYSGITTIDPISGYSDLRVNSAFTIDEMRDFQTEGALWEAEAARGAHDDCLIALGIAHYVAHRMQAGESEPLEDRRRRRKAESLRRLAQGDGARLDFRNGDFSAEQARDVGPLSAEEEDEQHEHWHFDDRSTGGRGTL